MSNMAEIELTLKLISARRTHFIISFKVSAVRLVTSPSKSPGASQEQGASCHQSPDTITGEEMLFI